MILTGAEIAKQVARRLITIDPFNADQLNPNSYNYRLLPLLRVSKTHEIRPGGEWIDVVIPRRGVVLRPERLYLGCTVEKIGSHAFVPLLIGRSSLGRLGVFLTTSADMGNLGEPHRWTLEIKVVQPVKIYPLMKIGQVSFWKPSGRKITRHSLYTRHQEPMQTLMNYAPIDV